MSKVQMLRAQVSQRLTAAVDEILGLFERAIEESEEENVRLRKLLRAVFDPEVRLHRAVFPADIQQLLVQQEWSHSLDQEEPEPPQVKEEQEELWTSEEGEQFHGFDEAEITKCAFILVPVKSEADEATVQSSELHQSQTKENTEAELLSSSSAEKTKTEADGENFGGPATNKVLPVDSQLQRWSISQDQEEPKPCHVKEEQDEILISQDRDLQGLMEADITKFPFTLVPVNQVDDEAKFQSSQLPQRQTDEITKPEPLTSSSTEQTKTEADGDDCGGPKPARNFDSFSHLKPASDDKGLGFSEHETELGKDNWKKTRESQSGLSTQKNKEVCVSDIGSGVVKKSFSCSEYYATLNSKGNLQRHVTVHTGERPFSCTVCGKSFVRNGDLKIHMRIHTGERPFSCTVCGKSFVQNGHMKTHMRYHTGERLISCTVCGKSFAHNGAMKTHMRIHTGERLFSCTVCGKSFVHNGAMKTHMRIHTGERPFKCTVCGKSFIHNGDLKMHMRIHSGERPFSCTVCGKSFVQIGAMRTHMRIHTGERPFSCTICGKSFFENGNLKKHMRIHTRE